MAGPLDDYLGKDLAADGADFDADAEVTSGAFFRVEEGTTYGGRMIYLATTGTITVNTWCWGS